MYLSKESIVSDRKRCAFIISPLLLCCTFWKGFPCGSASKDSPCNAGDLGLIPGLGRYPGEGKGYPFQYSGLENSMDSTIRGIAKSQTQLSDFHLLESPWESSFSRRGGNNMESSLNSRFPPGSKKTEEMLSALCWPVVCRQLAAHCINVGLGIQTWKRAGQSHLNDGTRHTKLSHGPGIFFTT